MRKKQIDWHMKKTKLLIIIIFLLGFFLRLYKIVDIPPGLNRDEAAIGYTAYSLLKTGKDEHGTFLPVSLKSFGDWKLPLYPYVTVASVAVFGLNEFSVRLPSVIFGSLSLLLVYGIARTLFNSHKVALLAMLMLTLNPWHIFFSRVTSEANLGLFLILASVYSLLHGARSKFLVVLSFFLLGLSLYTYHGAHIFTPLFFVVLFLVFRGSLKHKSGAVGIAIFALLAFFIYANTLTSADKTKLSGLLPTNDVSLIHEQIDKSRVIYSEPLLAKLFHNRIALLGEIVLQNFVKTFSPEFLYTRGGTSTQHNIPNFGNFYIVEAPFLLLGLYYLFRYKNPYKWLLVAWLLIAPLGSAITRDGPHSARSLTLLPAIVFLTTYGIYEFVKSKKRFQHIAMLIVVVLFCINISVFMSRYFVVFPYKSYLAWGKQYKEMMTRVLALKDNYRDIVIARPHYSPYIYYLFYARPDPTVVQKELEYYPETDEGFAHAKSFDHIEYKKINWAHELHEPGMLYIDWVELFPEHATQSALSTSQKDIEDLKKEGRAGSHIVVNDIVSSRIIDTLYTPEGLPLLYFIETWVSSPAASRL